jgi:hypothetical protein
MCGRFSFGPGKAATPAWKIRCLSPPPHTSPMPGVQIAAVAREIGGRQVPVMHASRRVLESAIRFRPHDRNCERHRSDAFQQTFEVASKHPNTTRAGPARTDIDAFFFAQFGAFRLVRREKTEPEAGRRERRKPTREGPRPTAGAHCACRAERRALRNRAHETAFFVMFFAHAALVCRIEALIRTRPTRLRRRFAAGRRAPTR